MTDAATPGDDWEADIKIRRKGRLIRREIALGDTAENALYAASNDLERWTQELNAAELMRDLAKETRRDR